MWRVAQQQSARHYGMLEDFVSMVTEAVPQLLTDRQRSVLLLALRSKVTLCDPEPKDPPVSMETLPREQLGQDGSGLWTLVQRLSRRPEDRERLLQEVFGSSFDSALQALIAHFLSRIEQLFPVPDFKQAASWLDAAPGGVESCLQESDRAELRELLTNHSSCLRRAPASVNEDTEETLLSAWSHPLLTTLTNPEPSPDTEDQSHSASAEGSEGHLVKVEMDEQVEKMLVAVTTEQELSNQNTTSDKGVITPVEEVQGGSNQNTAVDDGVITPVEEEQEELTDQSQQTAIRSDPPCSEVTGNPLYRISHNSQRVAHRCPRCGKCFIYRSQVIRHLRTNRSCSSVSPAATPEDLQSPSADPGSEPRPPEPRPLKCHTCFQCGGVFRTKAELGSHLRSHRAAPVYHCDTCDRKFQHMSSLTNHKQTHLSQDRGGFTCSRCEQVFPTARERDAHRLQHRQTHLVCSVCAQNFRSQNALLRHLQTHAAEGAEPQYCCRYCDQTFTGVTQLRIHQRTHACRSFSCDLCSKAYASLAGLQAHRLSHGADSRFLCSQCGKRFKTRDGLEGHLRRHSGERPYRCPYCPKDFTALAGLNVHVRRHTGERPYVCTVCGKSWTSGGDLQKHLRTHTGEKPYSCSDCGKAFSISCHLTEHRRIHTGERPFSCPECGKCLRRKFDLQKHLLSHRGVRPHGCVYCDKSYTRKTHLNRHLLTHRQAEGAEPKLT